MVSDHFSWREVTASVIADEGGYDNIPPPYLFPYILRAAAGMERIRHLLGGNPVIVSSWYRSAKVNEVAGGVKQSGHLLGLAVDFVCPGFGFPSEVWEEIERSGWREFDQFIDEGGRWVHVSFDLRNRGEMLRFGINE